MCKALKKEAGLNNDTIKFQKANVAYTKTVRGAVAVTDLIRHFESLTKSGKPGHSITKIAADMYLSGMLIISLRVHDRFAYFFQGRALKSVLVKH